MNGSNWSTWLKVRNGPKQSKTLIGQTTQFSKLPNFHESKRTQIWKKYKRSSKCPAVANHQNGQHLTKFGNE